MIKADRYYKENLTEILNNGCLDENPRPKYKDGVTAYSKFITQIFEKYDISKGEFPITTLRSTAIKTGIKEIFWIYQKQSNDLQVARDMGIKWWDDWDIGDGTIGYRYGYTVKKYKLMDNLLEGLKNDPFSRRHIIDMYQYSDLNETEGLFPCAYKTTWSVRRKGGDLYLDMTLDQRSNDYVMAGFVNKVQYVALMMMVVGHLNNYKSETRYKVGIFAHMIQNLHIYDRHIDVVNELLNTEPSEEQPMIYLNVNKNFYDYTIDDFSYDNLTKTKIKSELEIAI